MPANCWNIPITKCRSRLPLPREKPMYVTLSGWTCWEWRKAPEDATFMEHTGFPSDETLAAFIDGRLDPETRGKVIAHMTTCSECYSVFVNATEMTAAAAAPESSRRSSRAGWLSVAVAATAAMMAVVFLVTPVRDHILPRGDAGMVALANAAPPERI